MLTKDLVLKHLTNLGLEDYVISTCVDDNGSGDYVKAIIPDLNMDKVWSASMDKKYYSMKLSLDFTMSFLQFKLSERLEGYLCNYSLCFAKETSGVSVSLILKRIEFHDLQGKYSPLFSFKLLPVAQMNSLNDVEKLRLSGYVA